MPGREPPRAPGHVAMVHPPPSHTAFARTLVAMSLISFSATLLLFSLFVSQDLGMIRSAPQILYMALCGVPQDNGIALPLIFVLSEIALLVGLGLLILPRLRPVARAATIAVVSVTILAFGVWVITSTPTTQEGASQAAASEAGVYVISPPRDLGPIAHDVALSNQDGAPTALSDLHGKPALIFFGYTHCPDICPLAMSDFLKVKRQMGAAAEGVHFVMVSVDGERDTPAVLKRYVQAFDASFIGLTAPAETVRPLADAFGARFQKDTPAGTQAAYLVSHTALSYVVDAQGRWVRAYPMNTPAERIARDLTGLIGR